MKVISERLFFFFFFFFLIYKKFFFLNYLTWLVLSRASKLLLKNKTKT
jgi:hypothetical protein